MKSGQMSEASFCEAIYDVIHEMTSKDDILGTKRVLVLKKIRRNIKLNGQMKMVCVINNASLINKHLKPVNSSPWELHKNSIKSLSGFTTWEITKLESLLRSERNFRKSKGINTDEAIMAFQVSEKGDFDSPKCSIFDLAENVKIVDDKWEYTLV